MRLSEFLPNPKGNAANEWVEIANDADTPADLSGWAIDDADGGGSPYHLPQVSVIAPHRLLVITLPKALLNNGGDTIRLLRPDGSVADQYVYAQSSANQSFCRAASNWKLCDPSPNAPNQAASPGTVVAVLPLVLAQSSNQSPSMHAQSVVDDSSPTPPHVWPQGAITGVPAFANATAGALYHGVARATPIILLSTPIHAAPATQPEDATPVAHPSKLSLGMGVGIFLFAAGGAISGYDWLRSRRMPSSSALAQAEPLDLLDDDLLEDEQDL